MCKIKLDFTSKLREQQFAFRRFLSVCVMRERSSTSSLTEAPLFSQNSGHNSIFQNVYKLLSNLPLNTIHSIVYVVTGLGTSVLCQEAAYEGLSDETTLLLPFTTYLGMFSVVFLPDSFFTKQSSRRRERDKMDEESMELISPEVTTPAPVKSSSRQGRGSTPAVFLKLGVSGIVILMIFFDFFGITLSLVGLQMCGSGLHTVVMSSIVVWAAFLSFVTLGKSITMIELSSLIMILVGLLFSAVAQTNLGMEHEEEQVVVAVSIAQTLPLINSTNFTSSPEIHPISYYAGAVAVQRVWMGMIVTLCAAWLYAANYILAEVVQTFKNAPNSQELCRRIGLSSTLISAVYIVLYTVPKWAEKVTMPVREAGGDQNRIFFILILTVFFHAIHMLSYFYIVKHSGAVKLGVLKATQAVSTFGVSAVAFCDRQESQCFTMERGIATIIVGAAVVMYSYSSVLKKKKRANRKKVSSEVELAFAG